MGFNSLEKNNEETGIVYPTDDHNITDFNEYWLIFGVEFGERLYHFLEKETYLKKYIKWKENESLNFKEIESVNIEQIIIDYWSCINGLPVEKDIIEECFENFWDESESSIIDGTLWFHFSWSLYSFIREKYKEVSLPKHDQVVDENSVFGNYLLFSLIENECANTNKKKKNSSRGKKKKNKNMGAISSQSHIQLISRVNTMDNENLTEEIKKQKIDLTECGLDKYWYQRYQLFTKFDLGIKMDHESWYSVTPEVISVHHSKRCKCDIIIDPFCGCGGNIIQFAYTCNFVIAGDNDINKLLLARNNSDVYGVTKMIDFVLADALHLLKCIRYDVTFLSPPWGGPRYLLEDKYSVEKHMKPSASKIFLSLNSSCHSLAFFLPKNIELKPLKKLAKKYFDGALELEKNLYKRKLKAKTVYFGKIVGQEEDNSSRCQM